MKKMMVFVLAMICVLTLLGCGQTQQTEIEETKPIFELSRVSKEQAAGFSYEEAAAVFLSDRVKFNGETEIKKNGFLNITKCAVEDTVEAYERAKTECTISYERVAVFYDSSYDMWQVFFFTSGPNGHSGDRQLVYLDGDGITRLIVTSPQSKTTEPAEELITLTLTPQYDHLQWRR